MSEASPGHHSAAHARRAIERAMMAIREIPIGFDREPLAHTLGRAVQCCYAVLDSEVIARVHYDGLDEARTLIVAAREKLDAISSEPLESIARASEALKLADSALSLGIEHVAQIHLARRLEIHGGRWEDVLPPSGPFHASHGVPRCHAIARRPMVPPISLDPTVELPNIQELPPAFAEVPLTIEALAKLKACPPAIALELPEEGAVSDLVEPIYVYVPPSSERDWLSRLGRTLLEDIAIGYVLREPNPNETWLDIRPFEDTLLSHLDAFVAFGDPVLPLISLYHAEADVPDEGRAFAAALVLGSIEGADTVGAAVAIMQCSQPEELPGWTTGLALAPSEHIEAAMEELTRHDRADLSAAAISVLDRRATLRDETARALRGRDEPEVARAMARALRGALPREEATTWLVALSEDPDLALVACSSLVIRDLRLGQTRIIELLGRYDAVVDEALHGLLCLAGTHGDAERLLRWASAAPTVAKARGLGRYGHSGGIAVLLDMFDPDEPELADACAEALERITGAGLFETIDLPWDFDLPPEVVEASEVPVPMRQVTRPTRDREAWRRWVHQHGKRFDDAVRYRAGQPFTLEHLVHELESALTPPARRPEVALELAIRIDASIKLDTGGWVAAQQRELTELAAHVERVHYPAGSWAVASAMPTPAAEEPTEARHIDLHGTMMGLRAVPLGPKGVLPFTGGASSSAQPRPPVEGGGLPFAPGSAAPAVETATPADEPPGPVYIIPSAPEPSPQPSDVDPLNVTLDGTSSAAAATGAQATAQRPTAATPFEGAGVRAQPQLDAALPVATPFDRRPGASAHPGGTAPSAPAEAPADMTLQVYAWLCVREPYGADYFTKALAMCGVQGLAPWQRWKGYWGARMAADPTLRARWSQLVEQQRAVLRRGR